MDLTNEAGERVPYAGYEEPMTEEQRELLEGVVDALSRRAIDLSQFSSVFAPVPNPELRIRPPL